MSLSVAGMMGAGLMRDERYFHFRKALSSPVLMIMILGISVHSAQHNTDLVTL